MRTVGQRHGLELIVEVCFDPKALTPQEAERKYREASPTNTILEVREASLVVCRQPIGVAS